MEKFSPKISSNIAICRLVGTELKKKFATFLKVPDYRCFRKPFMSKLNTIAAYCCSEKILNKGLFILRLQQVVH